MRSFLKLLRKELFGLRWFIVPLVVLSVLWHLFLLTKIGVWEEGVALGLGALPISFIPLWILITSFSIYRTEWNENTIYFMMSLPVSAWKITLTKLLAVVIGAVAGVTVIGLGLISLVMNSSIELIGEVFSVVPTSWFVYNGMLVISFCLLMLIAGVMTIQASYIVSRMANRFHGLVLLWVFLIIAWLIPRLSVLIEPLLRWLPSVKIIAGSVFDGVLTTQNIWIPLGPLVAPLLVAFSFFGLATWLWESQIELA